MAKELIAICDGTRFYASACGIYCPQYRDVPVIVTSGSEGIIIAANRLATEQCGIKKFSPVFQYKEVIRSKQVEVIESNFNLFGHLSENFQSVIANFFPESVSYSVDEMFCRFPVSLGDPIAYLSNVRKLVYKTTRTPIGVAASFNCTLAKVASWAAKHLPAYKGICVLDNIADVDRILSVMPVKSLWGVGRRIGARLETMGITKAIQLKNASVAKMKKEFGKPITSLMAELAGQVVFNWKDPESHKKDVISSTRSIKERLNNIADLHQALAYHTHEVLSKVRQQKSKVKQIKFFASSSPYEKNHAPHSASATVRLDYASSDTSHFLKILSEVLHQLVPTGPWVPIYKIGVIAESLTCAEHDQADFFAPKEDHRKMDVLDSINHRYGKHTMFLGAKGIGDIGERAESKQLPNPHSRWSDVPVIEC